MSVLKAAAEKLVSRMDPEEETQEASLLLEEIGRCRSLGSVTLEEVDSVRVNLERFSDAYLTSKALRLEKMSREVEQKALRVILVNILKEIAGTQLMSEGEELLEYAQELQGIANKMLSSSEIIKSEEVDVLGTQMNELRKKVHSAATQSPQLPPHTEVSTRALTESLVNGLLINTLPSLRSLLTLLEPWASQMPQTLMLELTSLIQEQLTPAHLQILPLSSLESLHIHCEDLKQQLLQAREVILITDMRTQADLAMDQEKRGYTELERLRLMRRERLLQEVSWIKRDSETLLTEYGGDCVVQDSQEKILDIIKEAEEALEKHGVEEEQVDRLRSRLEEVRREIVERYKGSDVGRTGADKEVGNENEKADEIEKLLEQIIEMRVMETMRINSDLTRVLSGLDQMKREIESITRVSTKRVEERIESLKTETEMMLAAEEKSQVKSRESKRCF